jgi:hypothetical protein
MVGSWDDYTFTQKDWDGMFQILCVVRLGLRLGLKWRKGDLLSRIMGDGGEDRDMIEIGEGEGEGRRDRSW